MKMLQGGLVSKKIYNKLVRSEIIDIIKADGKEAMYIELDARDETQLKMINNLLKEKLVEEANEVLGAKNRGDLLEEIGDVLDVVDEILTLTSERFYSMDETMKELDQIRASKNIRRGGFLKRDRSAHGYELKYIKLLSVDNGQETKD